MFKFRDISHLQKLQEQKLKLEIIDAVTATIAHNMITPLKSVSLLSRNIASNIGFDNRKDATLVYFTSQLLLSEVMLLLDKNQLDRDRFQPDFTSI
jgi:hypothetical protein